ncbi:hypothetical protein TrST_g14007 [Triparma strigata]|uniref:CRAL-TRIO domain-containing protein n=1 Tax=Triparma strigata TaxID=1606541 RepID=A0A9W7AUL5_9STRA|nr:hypothetical protein TrST_g14007 [Triparma strigata]
MSGNKQPVESPLRVSTPFDSETLSFLLHPSPDNAASKSDTTETSRYTLEYADDKFSFGDTHRMFQMKKIKLVLRNWKKASPPRVKVSIVCTNDANGLRRASAFTRASVEVKMVKGAEWTPAEEEGGFAMKRDRSAGDDVWNWTPYFQFTHQSFFASSKKPSAGALILNFSVDSKMLLSSKPVTVVRLSTASDSNDSVGESSVAIGSLSDAELGQLVRKRCGTKANVSDLLGQFPEQKNKRGKVDEFCGGGGGGGSPDEESNVFSSVFEEPPAVALSLAKPTAEGCTAPSAAAHTLSPEEVRWCQDLKTALDFAGIAHPNGDDFMIAQFAIVAKGNVDKAVQRIANYNRIVAGEFQYKTEEAMNSEALAFMDRQFPGMIHVCKQASGSPVTIAANMVKFLPGSVEWNDENWRAFVHDFMLEVDAANCDLEEVRKGIVYLQDGKGMGWKNFSVELEKRATCLYQDNYPVKFKRFYIVEAGVIIIAIIQICRLFMSKKLMSRMVSTSQADLYNVYGFQPSFLPQLFGGTHDENFETWLAARLARRAESARVVKIPER